MGLHVELFDEVRVLRVMNHLGRHEDVIAAVKVLREKIKPWVDSSDQELAVNVRSIEQDLLDNSHTAAIGLGRWDEALSLNAGIVKVVEGRGAALL